MTQKLNRILGKKVRVNGYEGYVDNVSFHGQPSGWTRIWLIQFEDGSSTTVTRLSDIRVFQNGEWLSWRKFTRRSDK